MSTSRARASLAVMVTGWVLRRGMKAGAGKGTVSTAMAPTGGRDGLPSAPAASTVAAATVHARATAQKDRIFIGMFAGVLTGHRRLNPGYGWGSLRPDLWSTSCSGPEPGSKTRMWGRLTPAEGLHNGSRGLVQFGLSFKVPGTGAHLIHQGEGEDQTEAKGKEHQVIREWLRGIGHGIKEMESNLPQSFAPKR